jgi:hypothetical protein
MPNLPHQESVAKYLQEYYGFPSDLEADLKKQSKAVGAKGASTLDKYVEQCIAKREEPDLKIKPVQISARDEAGRAPAGPALDPQARYVLMQMIRKVTAMRLEAISEAARPDRTVDVNKLAKALAAREKGAAAAIAKELKPLLGSQPTVDIAAKVLVGLEINPLQRQPAAGAKGYWGYVCRNRCCFWGWRCSWGCLLIGCWI